MSHHLAASEWVPKSTILRGVVGSTVHGTSLKDTSDRDEMGICIEPVRYTLGLQTFEQLIQRDKPEGVRSEAGDLDLVTYSLRKWVRLALKGNPSILLLLFVPQEQLVSVNTYGMELRDLAWAFASKQAANPYLGFIQQQKERLLGEIGQLRVTRSDLVKAYGYDTKYAGHIIRLGYQGVEYMTTGRLTLPMPEHAREDVLEIREGKWALDKVLTYAGELLKEIEDLRSTSPLPDQPNSQLIEQWMISTYTEHYW